MKRIPLIALIVLYPACIAFGQLSGVAEASRERIESARVQSEIERDQRRAPPLLPSTQPTESAVADDAANKADARLRDALAAAVAEVKQTDGYRSASADASTKEAALLAARRSGTPQQKLDASGAWLAAKSKAEKMVADAIAQDANITAAKLAADAAKNRLNDLRAARAGLEQKIFLVPAANESGRFAARLTVREIVAPDEMIVWHDSPSTLVAGAALLKGWDTSNAAEGLIFRLPGLVRVTGTKRVEDQTLFVVEPLR